MDERTRSGYLIIADISGYTALLTGTELEHAQGIIEDLQRTMHAALCPPFTFVKLEGDAIFSYADAATFTHGEAVLEAIEATYFAFRSRLADMQRNTTCECAACSSISTLDLKFVAHHGAFVRREILGSHDLAGPDVILVHRLLKNGVAADTGFRGYLLATNVCDQLLPHDATAVKRSEDAEGFGEVECVVRDLAPSAERRAAMHCVLVEPADADVGFTVDLDAPRALVWRYWIEPDKRVRWQDRVKSVVYEANDAGRIGAGAVGHCDHGSFTTDTRYLDWRPYDYFTVERRSSGGGLLSMAPPGMTETLRLVERPDGGTTASYHVRALTRGGRWKLMASRPIVRRQFKAMADALRRALAEDAAAE